MEWRLLRRYRTDKPTLGSLNLVNVGFVSWTLEPSREHPTAPCIPEGRYEIELRLSPKRGVEVPWILDVPGRTGIQIHKGNWADDPRGDDTDGCIVVGLTIGEDMVGRSQPAYESVMGMLIAARAAVERAWIEISEGRA